MTPQSLSSGGEATSDREPQTISGDPQPASTTVDEKFDDTETVEDNDDIPMVLPTITAKDYDTDKEFRDMYRHLQTQE